MSVRRQGSGRLTPADHERIRELAARGLGPQLIAEELGRHQSTVNWFMYVDGLRAPRQIDAPKSYMRGGRLVHRFTALEDAYIDALRVQDFGLTAIARLTSARFGTARNPHTIRCRLVMLAAREVTEASP